MARLTVGEFKNIQELAKSLNLDRSYVMRTLQLANLAPDIAERIIDGKQPDALSQGKLRGGIPESWAEQRSRFGFS